MKILSRKQQDEILKRMIALQVIFNKPVIEIRTRDENEAKKWQKILADMAIAISGKSGADKIMNTVHKYNE